MQRGTRPNVFSSNVKPNAPGSIPVFDFNSACTDERNAAIRHSRLGVQWRNVIRRAVIFYEIRCILWLRQGVDSKRSTISQWTQAEPLRHKGLEDEVPSEHDERTIWLWWRTRNTTRRERERKIEKRICVE